MRASSEAIPISLYIHIPWCVRKCPYCDFNSHKAPQNIPQRDYVNHLIEDLRSDLASYAIERPLHSIFIGGGTPSLFKPEHIEYLLNAINTHWPIHDTTEITMEANPGTVEQRYFKDYKTAGINRLSLGIQSFCDKKLERLGRIHSGKDALKAIDTVTQAGFTNYNLDLMFGLPEQTIEQGLDDLQQGLSLQPAHLSWYQLTLEPNTVFYKKPPKLPGHDLIAELHDIGQAELAHNGYQQYEVSAYAKSDQKCQHNLNYWEYGDYLGIGAGAHGKITLSDNTVIRTRKVKQPNSYLDREAGNYLAEKQIIAPEQQSFEYFLNRFRIKEPIPLSSIPTHISLQESTQQHLKKAVEKGLITLDKTTIRKTEHGEKFLDDLLSLFL